MGSQRKKILLGLSGIIGVWLTACAIVPLINVLKPFTPEQLLAVRGVESAVLALVFTRGRIFKGFGIDTVLAGVSLSLAALCLFKVTREWGANPAILLITLSPLVNFVFALIFGRKLSVSVLLSLGLMVGGIAVALQPWTWSSVNYDGLQLGLLGAAMFALFFEIISVEKRMPLMQQCFWHSFFMAGMGGLAGCLGCTPWPAQVDLYFRPDLLVFAVIGGLAHFYCRSLAFGHLSTDVASILTQGKTPAVILATGVILGERLDGYQWFGVASALGGAVLLCRWLTQSVTKKRPGQIIIQQFQPLWAWLQASPMR